MWRVPDWLRRLLEWLFGRIGNEATRVLVTVRLQDKATGQLGSEETTMPTLVPPGKNLRITLKPVDQDGQPASIDRADHPPAWSSSHADVTVTPDEGGLSALAAAPDGFRGAVQVQAAIDADLDAGEVRDLVAIIEAEWVSGEAQVLQTDVVLEDK